MRPEHDGIGAGRGRAWGGHGYGDGPGEGAAGIGDGYGGTDDHGYGGGLLAVNPAMRPVVAEQGDLPDPADR